MNEGLLILIVAFATLMMLNVPIAFVIGVATLLAAWAFGHHAVPLTIASNMANGVDSFALLAIPFFVLAGEIIGTGGLARRMIDFARCLVGRLPGGLALVNTLACMLFGAISGSATAAISSIGGTLVPEMTKSGYRKEFSSALTATAATTGLLIPPSNAMIVYAVVAANVSISSLFLAGVLPGILLGLCIGATAFVLCLRDPALAAHQTALPRFLPSLLGSLPSLLLIIFVLGGILSGRFTATEASAVAVLWAFVLAFVVYHELPLSALPGLLARSARTTGVVLFLVATSVAMSQLLTIEQVPQAISAALLGLSQNPLVLLILINLILLVVGFFMDLTPAILVFTPLFLPVAMDLGIDPIHFGIILITNLCIGLCTPPVGTCLFVGCSVGHATIAGVSRAMIPFYFAMIAALIGINAISALSLWLPGLLSK
jgi:tripartite ATP-independent transporter DctM subunit